MTSKCKHLGFDRYYSFKTIIISSTFLKIFIISQIKTFKGFLFEERRISSGSFKSGHLQQ